jgi:hypothetical protein
MHEFVVMAADYVANDTIVPWSSWRDESEIMCARPQLKHPAVDFFAIFVKEHKAVHSSISTHALGLYRGYAKRDRFSGFQR